MQLFNRRACKDFSPRIARITRIFPLGKGFNAKAQSSEGAAVFAWLPPSLRFGAASRPARKCGIVTTEAEERFIILGRSHLDKLQASRSRGRQTFKPELETTEQLEATSNEILFFRGTRLFFLP
jgi:hypothetical protein